MPPWRQQPAKPIQPPTQPAPTPAAIPGPWSRPQTPPPTQPQAVPASVAPTPTGEKDWGPIKPIRSVPKPDNQKMAYVLAQAEHVVNPEEEHARKKWVILGSILTLVVIIGGTLAFIFFGRAAQTPKLDSNSVTIVNSKPNNANVSTNGVFPGTNANQNANAAAALDSDKDGLTNKQEEQYGTDLNKADTDGDGYTDGQEVQGGYNPLGPGKL